MRARRRPLRLVPGAALLLAATDRHAAASAAAARRRPNVLYLLSDDMRADLGSYGLPVRTPNLDALSSSSLLFRRAYCQISVCSPSRQSFLMSLRPDRNKVWNFLDSNPKTVQAIPGHFRDVGGYLTLGLGKTFHEDRGAWNADRYFNTTGPFGLPYVRYRPNTCPNGNEGGGHCVAEDGQIWDHFLRLKTIEYLRHAARHSKDTDGDVPFFVMAGFRDPHAPWAAPQRMYDLYDEAEIAVPTHDTLGDGVPLIAWSPELRVCLANGTAFPYSYDSPVPDWVQRDQRRAYYAAVSYVDEHVGAILRVLEEEGVANNTIVVFHSDHGYALGEHGYWEKKSNFDLTVRVPLIMRVPGVTDKDGYNGTTGALFDLVDVFPTLASLAGLSPPEGVDGMDLSDLVRAGGGDGGASRHLRQTGRQPPRGRDAAYHQFPACSTPDFNHTRGQCNNVPASDFNFMGYSIRTDRWRYTCWYRWDGRRLEAKWDGGYADELYDHGGDDSTDMDKWENANLSADRPDVAKELRGRLEAFFRKRSMGGSGPPPRESAVSAS